MNKRLLTLVTMMAVTGSILAAPAAMASDIATLTQAATTVQQQTQVQLKSDTETPVKSAVTQQFRFRSQQSEEKGPQFADKDGNGVCDNFDEDFLPLRKMDGTGRDGEGQNFVDEDGDGVCDLCDDPIQARDRDQDGTGDQLQTRKSRPAERPAAPSPKADGSGNDGEGQNYVDADNDGVCDNSGDGPVRDQDQDCTGDQVRDRLQDGSGQGARKGR